MSNGRGFLAARATTYTLLALWYVASVQAATAKKGGADTSPFRIHLKEVAKPPGLQIVLENHSRQGQTYLHDSLRQPSWIVLTASSGRVLKPFDRRAVMRFDPTVSKSQYRQLGPGKQAALSTWKIAVDRDGNQSFGGGTFHYSNLPAGKYQARAVWTSAKKTWYDRFSRRRGRVERIWLGTVTSKAVRLSIPRKIPKKKQPPSLRTR